VKAFHILCDAAKQRRYVVKYQVGIRVGEHEQAKDFREALAVASMFMERQVPLYQNTFTRERECITVEARGLRGVDRDVVVFERWPPMEKNLVPEWRLFSYAPLWAEEFVYG
jgi:hypothetical protein